MNEMYDIYLYTYLYIYLFISYISIQASVCLFISSSIYGCISLCMWVEEVFGLVNPGSEQILCIWSSQSQLIWQSGRKNVQAYVCLN